MHNVFVEVDYKQQQKHGNEICGDVFLSHKIKAENRTIVILSDGLGSGTKANILASMTASMAMNFVKANSPIEHTAKIIMNTLPVDSVRKISFSSFTILDIESDLTVKMTEFGNPFALIYRNGEFYEPEKKEINLEKTLVKQRLYTSKFIIGLNDRIVLYSDGVTQSGMGSRTMPFGWERNGLKIYLTKEIEKETKISSTELAARVLQKSLQNDGLKSRDDITCGVINFRNPRKVLFCTGPPYNERNDKFLAEQVDSFNGKKIVSGGTTAQIIARELNKEIETDIQQQIKGLPPESLINGIDLVTEGILTLGKVSEYLENLEQLPPTIHGPAGKIIRCFQRNDEIIFLVGTRVNDAHQDPNLPVELEIRRNVIKKIAKNLEDKFLKKVDINYL